MSDILYNHLLFALKSSYRLKPTLSYVLVSYLNNNQVDT